MIKVENGMTQITGSGKDVLNDFCNVVRAIYVSISKTDGAKKAETAIRELVDMVIKMEQTKPENKKQDENRKEQEFYSDLASAFLAAVILGGMRHDTD